MTARSTIRWFVFAAMLAASGCFDFDKALRDCRDDGGAWVCGPSDGGADGGSGGGSGGGAGGGSGGGAGGGSGGAGGGAGFVTDGGCPGLVRQGWCWENPTPGGVNLIDVAGTSDNDVWFVGSSGTLLHFDGTRFNEEPVPWVFTGEATSISMLADGGAWVGGDGIGNVLYRRTSAGWVAGGQVAARVRQIVALPNGDVLAATETGIVNSTVTWFPPSDGTFTSCSGVLWAPELGDGGFLAACGYEETGTGLTARQLVRSDGTVELRETQIDGGDPSFFFNRLFQDGRGRRFATGGGTMSFGNSFGSTHLRSDAGSWSTHYLYEVGSGATDLYAGAGFGSTGSHLVVGQRSRFATFLAQGTTPSQIGQLPQTSDGVTRGLWLSPQGTLWIAGDHGYAGAVDPNLSPLNPSVLRSGPAVEFYGAEIVGAQLLAVGAPATQGWFFPNRNPGPPLPNQRWRGVWLSPQGTLWFAAESGAVVRGTQTVTGASDAYKDVWGLSDDEVYFPHGNGLRRWLNGSLDSPVTSGDLWKAHGDPSSGEVWTVGLGATIYRRAHRDAGFVQVAAPAGFTQDLFAVRLLAPGRVAVSGNGGKIFESEPDGGWFELEPDPASGSAFYDIYPATDGGYYAVGAAQSVVRVHTNRSFTNIPIPTTSQLERVRPVNGRLYVVGGNGQVLSMPEP